MCSGIDLLTAVVLTGMALYGQLLRSCRELSQHVLAHVQLAARVIFSFADKHTWKMIRQCVHVGACAWAATKPEIRLGTCKGQE